jgi:hypothetical protein
VIVEQYLKPLPIGSNGRGKLWYTSGMKILERPALDRILDPVGRSELFIALCHADRRFLLPVFSGMLRV